MYPDRYEQFPSFPDGIPFSLDPQIVRDIWTTNPESNWHENLEIELCISGEGEVLIEGTKHAFLPGDIAVANPNALHHTGTEGHLVYACLIFDVDFCKQSRIDLDSLKFESYFTSTRVLSLITEIITAHAFLKDPFRIPRLRCLALSLLLELCENHLAAINIDQTKPDEHQCVKNAITYIRKNYASHFSLDDLERSIFVNKYTLSRQFKQVTHQTIMDYTNSYRCVRAARLLSEGVSVSTAAAKCGFLNLSYFAQIFRRNMGELPSAYRMRHRAASPDIAPNFP
ncbi:helix-turn-helix domain-containing protein [Beduinella massiliensis]|uniref:helix-turn-helix domain-containing protein n=1 Tax=Beduinella massiliensis TaxID=1852363 RepID=UPI000C814E2A